MSTSVQRLKSLLGPAVCWSIALFSLVQSFSVVVQDLTTPVVSAQASARRTKGRPVKSTTSKSTESTTPTEDSDSDRPLTPRERRKMIQDKAIARRKEKGLPLNVMDRDLPESHGSDFHQQVPDQYTERKVEERDVERYRAEKEREKADSAGQRRPAQNNQDQGTRSRVQNSVAEDKTRISPSNPRFNEFHIKTTEVPAEETPDSNYAICLGRCDMCHDYVEYAVSRGAGEEGSPGASDSPRVLSQYLDFCPRQRPERVEDIAAREAHVMSYLNDTRICSWGEKTNHPALGLDFHVYTYYYGYLNIFQMDVLVLFNQFRRTVAKDLQNRIYYAAACTLTTHDIIESYHRLSQMAGGEPQITLEPKADWQPFLDATLNLCRQMQDRSLKLVPRVFFDFSLFVFNPFSSRILIKKHG